MSARNATAEDFSRYYLGEPNSGCWLWTGFLNDKGYGRVRWGGPKRLAHVVSYELHVGAVPEGKELDHTCRVRACVNPAHLEAVTHLQNMQRSEPATKLTCLRGHPRSEENTEKYGAHGHRYVRCLVCYAERYPGTKKGNRNAMPTLRR